MIAKPRSTRAAWAAAAVAMTLVAVLLYANLTSPDQPVEHAIPHRYSTQDPQFQRAMTHLLGPPVVPGNRVTALLNGDQALVRRASRAKWGPLLEAGVNIYEYQPTMYHTKVMVVDDYWVSVGSTNFDNRSFRLNDGANLNVFDEEFARAQAGVFAEDRARSRKVTLEEWRRRPIGERLQELVGRMMRHQL